ncbi:MAG: tRNA lysidine(34) synthetase TilS [Rhodospirillales bacterium]|nr:tRNA lysidine(34) synthetase TilS [Rhodospirillales bacterium]
MTSYLLSPAFLASHQKIAVALSGGPDSMALTHMLSNICKEHGGTTEIHALIVNHNLRLEAATEAAETQAHAQEFFNLRAHILIWNTPEKNTRIMEAARAARYDLMAAYCKEHQIPVLYLAHHGDDQAETVLFRLAKGSGLDGLGGMHETQAYSEDLTLLRPLLSYSKADLLSYCAEHNLPYALDPSNENTSYARPRLRKSLTVLAEEGLTSKRLSVTAARLHRARTALDWFCEKIWQEVANVSPQQIMLDLEQLKPYPAEIHLRLLQKAIMSFCADHSYAPRLEKMEQIAADLFAPAPFRKRTFAGILFSIKANHLILQQEKA